MKRILLTVIVSLAVGAMAYAQQGTTQPATTQPATTQATTTQATTTQSTSAASTSTSVPTADQTRQSAQQLLSQSTSSATQFDTNLAELRTLNTNNADAANLTRLTNEISSIEANITSEQQAIRANLEKGSRLSPGSLNQLEQLITEHKSKLTELQAFIQSIQQN